MTQKTPENLLPYGDGNQKHEQVETMFNKIAPSYDFMNRLMSFRQDIMWRKKALKTLLNKSHETILDVATGTGDFAIDAYKMLKPVKITGIDLSEEMMKVAVEKTKALGINDNFVFEKQDCMSLGFKSESFDVVLAAFGVRNFENIAQGISEMYRVIKPGGNLIILELSRPSWFPANLVFKFYSGVFMPLAGKLFTKDYKAYEYLPQSIQLVPQGQEMVKILNDCGFVGTKCKTFTFGVCSMYSGQKV